MVGTHERTHPELVVIIQGLFHGVFHPRFGLVKVSGFRAQFFHDVGQASVESLALDDAGGDADRQILAEVVDLVDPLRDVRAQNDPSLARWRKRVQAIHGLFTLPVLLRR